MMRKWGIVIPLVVVAILVVVFVTKRANEFATAMGCAGSVLSATPSPDGKAVAYVFYRACGATAPDSTQVNIQPIGTPYDSEKYKVFVVVGGAPVLTLRWESANRLAVSGIASERIYRQESSVGNVEIEYDIAQSRN